MSLKTKRKNKLNKRKSLSSLKIILPHSALYSITPTPQFFCKERRVNRDVCYCFMAMKCGANAEPPSDDPCAACLGPGFISIMRSIYSAAMTRGYEKKPDSFKNTGTSAKSCLKGRANSQMKLTWYVCSRKVVNWAREKKKKKKNGRPVAKQAAAKENSAYLWILRRAGLYSGTGFNIVAPQSGYCICLYLETPIYWSVYCRNVRNGRAFGKI